MRAVAPSLPGKRLLHVLSGIRAHLRSGAWVTRERIRLVALAVLAAGIIGFGWLVATSDGLNDFKGRPLGTDFSNVYAAGTYVLDGEPLKPFDWPAQHAREQQIFGAKTPFYGWHYPPFFLFLAAPLASMPYPLALAVWQGVTFALYLWMLSAILSTTSWPGEQSLQRLRGLSRPSTPSKRVENDVDARHKAGHDGSGIGGLGLLLACAYPAVFINVGHGHNGFLTAALLGGALVLLDRRPWLAGILFGLLAYKPQFGLMIPLVLLATGRWRTIAAACITVAVLVVATTLAFGVDIWNAFLASTHLTRTVVLEQGDTGWYKIQSIFSWVRMWGGSVPLAYAVQGAATVTIAAVLVWQWRSRIDFAFKAAALAIAAILATPYSLDYDLMVLAPAIAFLAARGMSAGFAPYERTMLACLWIVPLMARSFAEATQIPLAVPTMMVMLAFIVSVAVRDSGRPWPFSPQAVK